MVRDLMVCVDRIIASACFGTSNGQVAGGEGGGCDASPAVVGAGGFVQEEGCLVSGKEEAMHEKNSMEKKGGRGRELVECRICQEEGEESDMENPCACTGTLKFAHRKCIQKWCIKKKNTTCEICNQLYTPNYSAPPPQTGSDVLAIDIRQAWGARIDLHDSHFLAIAAAEQELLHAEYEDHAAAHNVGIACCRNVTLILMLLLFLRQILMVTSDPVSLEDVSSFFYASLQFAGLLLPCYVVARSCYLLQIQRRHHAWL
ncbi:E3 ubiquitin-protein ligase MARCH6 [Apostasia shenzhenica]|uniref:E3 ubiquitin-protein ligase MARCH6 n=1 Tax=Apostasia shenzhenica TaxID=1088818 RepID=A0A2I0B182_9ASPA|nr:E3 ubiquitin-protein ligase MARCH6 [Apostasia shenzhenica]